MLKFYPEPTQSFIKTYIISCITDSNDFKPSIKYEKLIPIYYTFDSLSEDILDFIMLKDQDFPNLVTHRRIELCLVKMKSNNPLPHEDKIEEIINKQKTKFDQNYILTLFKTYDYKKGLIQLSEMMNLRQELLVVYMDTHEYDKIIDICKGGAEKNYWIQALNYFISRNLDEYVSTKIIEVLDYVLENDIIAPYMVLELFKSSSEATLGLIQSYLINFIEAESEVISKNQSELKKNEDVNAQFDNDITDFRTKASKITLTKCPLCKKPLTLNQARQLIIFFCNHVYHADCLNYEIRDENSNEEITKCPQCMNRSHTVNQRIMQSLEKADKHNEFRMELDSKEKKFDQIAKYLGMGVFNMP